MHFLVKAISRVAFRESARDGEAWPGRLGFPLLLLMWAPSRHNMGQEEQASPRGRTCHGAYRRRPASWADARKIFSAER